MGSTIDTRKGRVELTSVPKAGAPPEKAQFYDGLFKVTQSKGITILTLTEVLDCPKGKGALGRAEEAQEAQALGRRQGRVPDRGQVQRRDRARHAGGSSRTRARRPRPRCKLGSVTVEDKVKRQRTSSGRRKTLRRQGEEVGATAGHRGVRRAGVQRGARARRHVPGQHDRLDGAVRATPVTCSLRGALRPRSGNGTPEDDVINVPAGAYLVPELSLARRPRRGSTIVGAGRERHGHPAAADQPRVPADSQAGLDAARADGARRAAGDAAAAATSGVDTASLDARRRAGHRRRGAAAAAGSRSLGSAAITITRSLIDTTAPPGLGSGGGICAARRRRQPTR